MQPYLHFRTISFVPNLNLLVFSKESKSKVRSIDIHFYLSENKCDLLPIPKIFLTLIMKKLNFQETLKLLQSDDIYSSCDESDFDETQLIESFSSEDSEEDDSIIEDEVVCIEQENLSNVQASSSSHFSNEEVQTRSGIIWKRFQEGQSSRGRFPLENVFTPKPGPTAYSCRQVMKESPLSAFQLYIDEIMLRSIQKYTIHHAHLDDKNFNCPLEELEKFIGLQIARGVLEKKNTPVKQLWSKEWGHPIFASTLSRNRFESIMKHLRFDNVSTRSERRRKSEKFCLISETWNAFIENCQKCYVPNLNLTIDEQLFPCKTRCPFTQYMPNKPDKFGMKFWLLADSKSKYLCNGKPYLGKDPLRKKENDLPTDMCLSLLKPYFKKGYNVTTNNFFTNVKLAETLKLEKTTIVGTVRKQRKEIPSVESTMKKASIFSSEILLSDSGCSLTIYKAKKNKIVYILSSMHKDVSIDKNHSKKRPETVEYYNKTKAGVDVLDQMSRYHTCKSATRRWPAACFFNIIDCACINAFIVYKEVTKSSISRRKFLLELVKELCRYNKIAESEPSSNPKCSDSTNSPRSLKRKHCQIDNCPNKSNNYCIECKKFCCGFHTKAKKLIVTCSKCVKNL